MPFPPPLAHHYIFNSFGVLIAVAFVLFFFFFLLYMYQDGSIARNAQGVEINLSVQHVLNCGGHLAGSCHGGTPSGA